MSCINNISHNQIFENSSSTWCHQYLQEVKCHMITKKVSAWRIVLTFWQIMCLRFKKIVWVDDLSRGKMNFGNRKSVSFHWIRSHKGAWIVMVLCYICVSVTIYKLKTTLFLFVCLCVGCSYCTADVQL